MAKGGYDLLDHFGLTEEDREAEIEAYQHHMKWSNRMILGDGVAVMASLAEREGLKGQVQAIYIDLPYGIKFNSNFQWSTTSRDVKDGNLDHLTGVESPRLSRYMAGWDTFLPRLPA